MKISTLIEKLKVIQAEEGDIEVTCTAAHGEEDGWNNYETTVENLVVHTEPKGNLQKRVRLYL